MTWNSSDTSVAVGDASGLMTAASEGPASAVVAVGQSAALVGVSPSEGTVVVGDTQQLAAEAFDVNGHAVAAAEFLWESSEMSVWSPSRWRSLFDKRPDELRVGVLAATPDAMHQGVVGRDPPGCEREDTEELVLGGRELHPPVSDGHPASIVVDRELAHGENLGIGMPSQDRPGARHELRRRERFDDVVGGPGIKLPGGRSSRPAHRRR